MDEQFLYSVEYHDWNADLSNLISRSVLAVGKDEEEAIENAKQHAQTDSRDFTATKIDAVMGLDISVAGLEERARGERVGEGPPSIAASGEQPRAPIQVYIENTQNESVGGFTIPLPTTKEALEPWLKAIEADGFEDSGIVVREARSPVPGLEFDLDGPYAGGLSFDELNYLAAKIQGLNTWQMDMFVAVVEAELHCESVGELINLTENIDRYDLQPAFSEEQYGEFLLEMEKDNSADIFERLEKSEVPEEREFAQYILRLEAHVDTGAYGRAVEREEEGVFTKYGYIALRGEFQEAYRIPADIPLEHRIFSAPPPPMMAVDVGVPSFLAQLHAVAGDYSRDAEYNLNTLANLRSAEYLLLMDGSTALLTESMHAYRRGTTAFDQWMGALEKPGAQAFSIHLTEVHGRIAGDIAQVDISARHLDILHHSIQYTRVDAATKSGEEQSFAPKEWEEMSAIDRDKIESWTRHFDADDLRSVIAHLDDLRERTESACRNVDASEFLSEVNAAYMEQAQYPYANMLRVSQTAAKEMLARGDGEVYRLLPESPEKLSPTDAVKSGLWFTQNREFAIRREDAAGLHKWAERSAADIMNRPQERGEHKKSHEPEV